MLIQLRLENTYIMTLYHAVGNTHVEIDTYVVRM